MDHPDLIVCTLMENFIGLKRVNYLWCHVLPLFMKNVMDTLMIDECHSFYCLKRLCSTSPKGISDAFTVTRSLKSPFFQMTVMKPLCYDKYSKNKCE